MDNLLEIRLPKTFSALHLLLNLITGPIKVILEIKNLTNPLKYVYIRNLTYTWSDTIRSWQNMYRNATDRGGGVKFEISRIPLIGLVTRCSAENIWKSDLNEIIIWTLRGTCNYFFSILFVLRNTLHDLIKY